jgi:hypothetical protein
MPQPGAAVQGVIVVDFASRCDSSPPCRLGLTIPIFRSTIMARSAECPVTCAVFPARYDFPIR